MEELLEELIGIRGYYISELDHEYKASWPGYSIAEIEKAEAETRESLILQTKIKELTKIIECIKDRYL